MPKFKTTLTVEITVEHVLDITDEQLEGFDWESADPEQIAAFLQRLDDDSGSEYTREFPNIDLAHGVGEVQTAELTHAVPVPSQAADADWGTYACSHCGQPATETVHDSGSHRGKQRCGRESGLEYGYNAHPSDVPCDNEKTLCLGARHPDLRTAGDGTQYAIKGATDGVVHPAGGIRS